jgi:hypothetical protein
MQKTQSLQSQLVAPLTSSMCVTSAKKADLVNSDPGKRGQKNLYMYEDQRVAKTSSPERMSFP